jgi:hypothetical protein
MSRLIREHVDVDAAILNLLEHKCTVFDGTLRRIMYWWPFRNGCVVYNGRDYDILSSSSDGNDITIRNIMAAYEFGGESNSLFVLESGIGLIHNILDTPISELWEGTVVRVHDNASDVSSNNNDNNDLVSRILRDIELQEMGGERVGSEEFHPSDAQIAAEMFAQE